MSCSTTPCNCTASDVQAGETLPSALDNFILHFFGEVTKNVADDGTVTWELPCDLEEGLEEHPRVEGEGLACYFIRLFHEGVKGYTGPTGPSGSNGAPGVNGYAVLTQDYTVGDPYLVVDNPGVLPSGLQFFLEGAGWYFVGLQEVVGSETRIYVSLVQAILSPVVTVVAGSKALPSGPNGAQGITGPQGLAGMVGGIGPTGPTGPTGTAGMNGVSSATRLLTSFSQPAVGSTASAVVADPTLFVAGCQVFIKDGGYYEVVSIAGNTLTVRNLGGTTNLGSGTVPASSLATVFLAGVGAQAPSASITCSGSALYLASVSTYTKVTFDQDFAVTLPMPGTYFLNFQVQASAGSYGSGDLLYLHLYNETESKVIANTERILYPPALSYFDATLTAIITVGAASTVCVRAKVASGATVSLQPDGCAAQWLRVSRV